MSKHHLLKVKSEFFLAVQRGDKKFEIRKNDRGFEVGDTIKLLEVRDGIETGYSLPPLKIRYILKGGMYGLDKNYCIINW